MSRSQVFQFRLSGEEKARIEGNAERAGLRASEFVRLRALEEGQGRDLLAEVAPPGGGSSVPPRAPEDPLNPDVAPLTVLSRRLLESTVAFRCPNGCNPGWRPRSASAKCGSCGRTVVPG